MPGLEMKYFVLNPRSKHPEDPYANASRLAMLAYAEAIERENHDLFYDLTKWVSDEQRKEDGL